MIKGLQCGIVSAQVTDLSSEVFLFLQWIRFVDEIIMGTSFLKASGRICYQAWKTPYPVSGECADIFMEVTCTKWKARIVPYHWPRKETMNLSVCLWLKECIFYFILVLTRGLLSDNFSPYNENYWWLSWMSHIICALWFSPCHLTIGHLFPPSFFHVCLFCQLIILDTKVMPGLSVHLWSVSETPILLNVKAQCK